MISFGKNDQLWPNALICTSFGKKKSKYKMALKLDIVDNEIVIFEFSGLLYGGFQKAIFDFSFFFANAVTD